jgi:subtilisin
VHLSHSHAKTVQESKGREVNTYSLPPIFRGADYETAAASWAFAAWDVDALRSKHDGTGVTVAVLDTGADDTHPDLAGRIVKQRDFTSSRIGYRDSHGHGTHCLGTVGGKSREIGVSNAFLLNGKVLGDSGSGSDQGIAAGIDWAVSEGADVISMSLGSSGPSSSIKNACDRAAAKGVLVIAAAGNEGRAGVGYPGGYDSCISVAAIDRAFKVANFSSRGDKLDCSGPGVDIVSAKPGGGYQSMSGTSMATPFIAGLFACIVGLMKAESVPMLNVAGWRSLLHTRTVDLGVSGDDTDYGPGWLSPLMIGLNFVPNPKPIGV